MTFTLGYSFGVEGAELVEVAENEI